MTKLNERKIIQIFQKNMGNNKFVSEDVEFFKIGKTNFVAKVDTLVQSTDIPSGMKLQEKMSKQFEKIITIDGIKAIIDDDSWVLVRKSNTEDIIRISAESNNSEKVKTIVQQTRDLVNQSYDEVK